MNLTDPNRIRALLSRHGFHFSKSMGQNFLIQDWVPQQIADAAGLDADCGVLEIGPGIGPLTVQLAQRAGRVAAVELDRSLLPILAETLADFPNARVIPGDVMKLDLAQLIQEEFEGGPVCVCANLPYYITSPVILRLLEERLPVTSITVMVQKEAAVRLCAAPGSKECGAVSAAVHYRARPRILFQVGRGSFLPPPKVDSAVIRLDLLPEPPVRVADEDWFFQVVRGAFAQRRKTAANSLSSALGLEKARIEAALEGRGISPAIRAERLTLEQLADLSNALEKGACAPEKKRVQ